MKRSALPASRLARALAGAILLVAAVSLAGLATEKALSARDARRFPPPGRLVDVGNRTLHLRCDGEGSPTLLFEMGAGAWGLYWSRIQSETSRITRSCVYDRAGYGWSDPGPSPRSPDALLSDLRALVERSGERPPFILVGHSLGGWLVRLYRDRYPEDVAGIALVESAHPRQWEELPPEIWRFTRSTVTPLRLLGAAGRFGVLRLLSGRIARQRLPADVLPAYRATALRPSSLATLASEIENSPRLAEEVRKTASLGDLPLVVVSAGRSFDAFREIAPDWPFDRANETWATLQHDLVGLSTHSWQLVSPDATHDIHVDDPELIVTALGELIDSARARDWGRGLEAGAARPPAMPPPSHSED